VGRRETAVAEKEGAVGRRRAPVAEKESAESDAGESAGECVALWWDAPSAPAFGRAWY
jgi:hypothetical protein